MSIAQDYDIMNLAKQYKRRGKTIYAFTKEEASDNIIKRLKNSNLGNRFI